jgi:hypothetical protein
MLIFISRISSAQFADVWGFRRRRWTWAAAGRPAHGMLGSAGPALFLPWRVRDSESLAELNVCAAGPAGRGVLRPGSVYTVTAVAPRARASGPGRSDGTTLRRRRARLAGSLLARFAALGRLSGPGRPRRGRSGPFAPRRVLARTWSGLSASSPAGAASVN